jgi:hypothetical protein
MIVRVAIVAAATMIGTAAAEATVVHVPPADVVAGTPLELVAEAAPATPTLTVHYRVTGGAGAFQTLELVRRGEAQWVAVVPAAAVVSPGIDYFIAAGGTPVFASESWPHRMPVVATASTERRARDIVRSKGRRSRIHTSFEWVDYGTRTIGGEKLEDHYYRVDADFAYRLWAYPLEELRVGYTRLIGETCQVPPCSGEAGFKVAGWFELGLAPVEGFRLDTRVAVMATQSGFQPGVREEVRLGVREGSHIALGIEYLADVGTNGFFRLGWGTVPSFPMAASVEITRLPDSSRDAGVRLYYDIAHALPNGVRLGARVGYAARNQAVAGFTGGANASVEF